MTAGGKSSNDGNIFSFNGNIFSLCVTNLSLEENAFSLGVSVFPFNAHMFSQGSCVHCEKKISSLRADIFPSTQKIMTASCALLFW